MIVRKSLQYLAKGPRPLGVPAFRLMSTTGFIKAKEVNKNLKIVHHTLPHPEETRPMVLLFGWLLAKPAHLKKFTEFYLQQGFDVLSVQIFLGQLLRPKKVQELMRRVLDVCHHDDHYKKPIICHGLSVGGYLYGEVLNSVIDFSNEYGNFGNRVYGQIFDSPVDFYGIPRGVARAVTNNKENWDKIETRLEWYMDKFENVTKDYVRSSKTFQSNFLKTPTLFLYSLNDPVCNPDHIERVAGEWRATGIEAETVFWDRAPHVTSFKMYPDEYKYHVKDFIWRTGIPGHKMLKSDLQIPSKDYEKNQTRGRVENIIAVA